jgi:hypothetical protein
VAVSAPKAAGRRIARSQLQVVEARLADLHQLRTIVVPSDQDRFGSPPAFVILRESRASGRVCGRFRSSRVAILRGAERFLRVADHDRRLEAIGQQVDVESPNHPSIE